MTRVTAVLRSTILCRLDKGINLIVKGREEGVPSRVEAEGSSSRLRCLKKAGRDTAEIVRLESRKNLYHLCRIIGEVVYFSDSAHCLVRLCISRRVEVQTLNLEAIQFFRLPDNFLVLLISHCFNFNSAHSFEQS